MYVQHSSADEEWVKWSLTNSRINQGGWEGNSRPSSKQDWPPVEINQSAESHWTTFSAEKREGRKVLVVLTVLEGNCSRYGEAVNIVTDLVTMCRHK